MVAEPESAADQVRFAPPSVRPSPPPRDRATRESVARFWAIVLFVYLVLGCYCCCCFPLSRECLGIDQIIKMDTLIFGMFAGRRCGCAPGQGQIKRRFCLPGPLAA